jgi:hypothetical protein
MHALGSRTGEWKFGKRAIYSYRAHIATSFVPATIVIGRAYFRGDLVIQGGRGGQSTFYEFQVSGLIVLHRNRFPIFGRVGTGGRTGVIRGFLIECGPTCMGDPVEGTHRGTPVHRIHAHECTIEGI